MGPYIVFPGRIAMDLRLIMFSNMEGKRPLSVFWLQWWTNRAPYLEISLSERVAVFTLVGVRNCSLPTLSSAETILTRRRRMFTALSPQSHTCLSVWALWE